MQVRPEDSTIDALDGLEQMMMIAPVNARKTKLST